MDHHFFSRVTFNPDRMGGKPCIRNMRVTVGMIVGLMNAGTTCKEILAAYPYLEEADFHEAVAFDRYMKPQMHDTL